MTAKLASTKKNLTLLDYVKREQPCTLAEIEDVLFNKHQYAVRVVALRARLKLLEAEGAIHESNGFWMHGPALRGSEADQATASPTHAALQVAPPRVVDLMNGPVYQPEPWHNPRPGATDFQRIASKGVRC